MYATGSASSATNPLLRRALSHDASHFLMTPQEIWAPKSAEQVAAALVSATTQQRHITFRAGGTSLSGQAVSDDILLDVRKHFRDIEVLDDGARVRVGVGATIRAVNAALAPYGAKLGPDPASEVACTIGGLVANNSSGMLCGTARNTYATLDSLVLALPNGLVIDTAAPDAEARLRDGAPDLVAGLLELRHELLADEAAVTEVRRQFSLKNTMGYGINSLLDFADPVDLLSHLLVGSEGTLAFVASAVFRTVPLHRHAATGLAIFDCLEDAAASIGALAAAGLDAIELMDATSLRVAQTLPAATDDLLATKIVEHTALLIEAQEATREALPERIARAEAALAELPLTSPCRLSTNAKHRQDLWAIRKGLYTTVAGNRAAGTSALLEDVAVPVPQLAPMCRSLIELIDQNGYEGSVIFGHAKDGNLHFMLNEDFTDEAKLRRYQRFTEALVELVLSFGGTCKAEHGTGRAMAPFVAAQYGAKLYRMMRTIKQLFDPAGILNPGVLITEDAAEYVRNLKTPVTVDPETDRCVECGYCEPICPSKNLTLTPRQRIVLRREAAAHPDDRELAAALAADANYSLADTCAVDGLCAISCPLGINTGNLVRRLRHETNSPLVGAAWHGAAHSWQAVTTGGSVAMTAAKAVAPLASFATRMGRTFVNSDLLPQYSADLPPGGRVRRDAARTGVNTEFWYFPACIQSMFAAGGDGVSAALAELCDRAGVPIRRLDARGLCCGVPWMSKGHRAGYETMRAKVRESLQRQGAATVICDAASCTHGLSELITDCPEIRFQDAVEFVATEVLPFLTVVSPLESIALHPTCSTTQLGITEHLQTIAEAMSNDVLVPKNWGCCAFAGDRGMLHPELTASATAAEAAEVNSRSFAAYASANRTCELGMSRATGHDYGHILELLAIATRPAA